MGYQNSAPAGQLMEPIPPETFPVFVVIVAGILFTLLVHRKAIRETLPWQAAIWLMYDDLLVNLHIRKPRGQS